MTQSIEMMTVGQIREHARGEAQNVLSKFWAGGQLPVDPVEIARDMGLSVFSSQLGDDVFGMLVANDGGADIYLDRDQPRSRFRFTCAHEIGHYVDRSARLGPNEAYIDKRSDDGRGLAPEVFANEFAASLLMPQAQMEKWVTAGVDDYDASEAFGVSLQAYRYRKSLLGLGK